MHVNLGLFDLHPSQKESLLQPYEVRAHSVVVDNVCKCHKGVDGCPGTQCIHVDGHEVSIHFDGLKQFLYISTPIDTDILCYPSGNLTPSEPYKPQHHQFLHHMTSSQVNI